MNRNQMYDYLKGLGLVPLFHWSDFGYHTEFVADAKKNEMMESVIFDWGYVRGFDSIHLCANEIVIECRHGFGKINVYYKDINKFEVRLMDRDEEY